MNNRIDENQITPEEARRELARRELERREISRLQSQIQSQQPAPDKESLKRHLEDMIGINRTPLNAIQDLGAGALRGGQNLAATLGEAGQGLGQLMSKIPGFSQLQRGVQGATGIRVPEVDVREELGLGKDRPVDLSQILASKNANPLAVGAGQFAPGIMAGGTSIPGQIASNALWGGVQAQPDQQNAFGFLPSGRPGAMIEGGIGAGLPFVAKPVAKALAKPISAVTKPIISATKSAINLPKAFTKINHKEVATAVQQSHDVLEKSATDLFDKVGSEAVKRNVDSIPIRKDLIADIADLEQLPTKKYKALLDKAYSGDYQSLRDLQADLWQKGTNGLKSPLRAEQNAGEHMMELREELNDSIINHFKKTGHLDLAEDLTKAKKYYKNLMDTYFSKKVPAAIKNLVHKESRKVPKNIMNVLSEDSKPMARIRNQTHPIVSKKVKDYENKQKAMKDLKNLGIAGGIATGISAPIGLATYLYKNIFGK